MYQIAEAGKRMVKLVHQFGEAGEGMVKLMELLSEGFPQNVNLGFRFDPAKNPM